MKKLEESDKNEVLEWIDKLVENDYHPVTTKNEIMELLQQKLQEQPDVMDPDIEVKPGIEVEPDVDTPNPDTDPFVDPWDNPGEGPDPRPKFQGDDKGMPQFLKFKEILQSINEKNDVSSLSESIMRKIKKVLKNG